MKVNANDTHSVGTSASAIGASATPLVAPSSANSRLASGLLFALISAGAFALSGPFARGLLDAGWTPGAAVTARVSLAALALAPVALIALRGRWYLLANRGNLVRLAVYGAIAVAGTQLAYFTAVATLQVGVALLIEYTAPAIVVLWMWLRHRQRPHALTLIGAAIAAGGLLLVLQIFGGVQLDVAGVLWALGAMVGVAFYFVMSADTDTELPGTVLAGGGLLVGTVVLGLAGLVGVLPMTVTDAPVELGGASMPWWVAVLVLGLVTAAGAYVAGIAAARRLGPRLTSFVGLSEVVAAVLFAWLLLGELPNPVQLVGGALIMVGVVVVRLGEAKISR